MSNCLAIRHSSDFAYPKNVPYDAGTAYPEWRDMPVSSEANSVYDGLRICFADLSLDEEHIGTEQWNPFSDFIVPGNTVVIKPNLVLNTHDPAIQECTTTHPALLRVLIDYTWKALNGNGTIIVGDAPGAEADFDEIVQRNHLRDMINVLRQRGVNVSLEDFRAVRVLTENGVWTGEQKKRDTVPSSQIVNLGEESLFADATYKHKTLHGAGYNIQDTNRHHSGAVQEYSVSKMILNADVVISVPKLKTHRKAGFTCCLKNLVGINTDKNYLPHFAMGPVNIGGDEMPEIAKKNVWRVNGYNWIRKHIISRTWKFIGGPGAKVLRKVYSGNKPSNDSKESDADKTNEASARPEMQAANAKDTDTDLAKKLHNTLSGQNVAAGAWSGNTTICRMVLDLNHIFLSCGRDGTLNDATDRKYFYVVDALSIGMGDGPTHPIPGAAQVLAAGFNGFELDTALLRLLGVEAMELPLYKMAANMPWMHRFNEGGGSYNGKQITGSERLPLRLLPPSDWTFTYI